MYLNSRVEITDLRNINDNFSGKSNVLLMYFVVFGRSRTSTDLFVYSCSLCFKPVHRLRE